MTAGPGQKVAPPLIDNFPSELGSLAIATPTSLLLVYSVHITSPFILAGAFTIYLQIWQAQPKCY